MRREKKCGKKSICSLRCFSLFALEYFFGEQNENCPIGRIVPTEEECKKASSLLGIEYKNKVKRADYPVGCHTKSDHSSYLNTQLDPSASYPAYFWPDGIGICRTGTMLNRVDPFSDFIVCAHIHRHTYNT